MSAAAAAAAAAAAGADDEAVEDGELLFDEDDRVEVKSMYSKKLYPATVTAIHPDASTYSVTYDGKLKDADGDISDKVEVDHTRVRKLVWGVAMGGRYGKEVAWSRKGDLRDAKEKAGFELMELCDESVVELSLKEERIVEVLEEGAKNKIMKWGDCGICALASRPGWKTTDGKEYVLVRLSPIIILNMLKCCRVGGAHWGTASHGKVKMACSCCGRTETAKGDKDAFIGTKENGYHPSGLVLDHQRVYFLRTILENGAEKDEGIGPARYV